MRYSATRKFLLPSSLKAWTSGDKPLMSCRERARSRRRGVYVRWRSTADRAGVAVTRSVVLTRDEPRLGIPTVIRSGKPFRPDARSNREFVRRGEHAHFLVGVANEQRNCPRAPPGALGVGRAGRREGVGRGPDGLPGRRFRGGGAKHVGAARGGARPPPGRAARDVRGRGEDRRREGVRGPARRAVVAGARRRRRRARARQRGERRRECRERRRRADRDDGETTPGRRRGPRGVCGVGGGETTVRRARAAHRRLGRYSFPARRRGRGPNAFGGAV